MLQIYWFALGAFATLWTVVWAVVLPDERVYFSAGLSAMAWIAMAIAAPTVETLTEAGERVSADPGTYIQLVIGVLGILSLIVIFLYRFGEYPPDTDAVEP